MYVRTLKQCNGRKPWSWMCFSVLCLIPICCSSPADPTCRQPCENVDCGPEPDNCPHGNFTRCEGCCIACANGPHDLCNPYSILVGPCGEGMDCIGLIPGIRPGTCQWSTPQPPSDPTPSPSPSPSSPATPMENSTETNETSGTPPSEPVNPTEGSTGDDDMAVTCRPACSVEFCSEKETKKRRICSAAGLSPVVPERNKCQHTTCRACFLLRDPDCSDFICPDPPNKDCLRRFYECIRDFYFGPMATANLLKLEDPAALTTSGRIACHVPGTGTGGGSQGAFDGQGSTSSTNEP